VIPLSGVYCSLFDGLFNGFFQIEYECVDGFELVGKDTRYCQSDGTWTPSELPTCVPVQCQIPDSPVNGKAMYTAVAYKSVVSYECKYGFMIVGDATRQVLLFLFLFLKRFIVPLSMYLQHHYRKNILSKINQ
jgi:hypothetical protein